MLMTMKNKILILVLLNIFFGTVFLHAQKVNSEDINAYIEKYKDIAVREMEAFGIPTSITLAQGILESAAGKSYLARKGNNHFGIKCHKSWKGKKVYLKDDDYVNGKKVKSCFRKYKYVEDSYIDHSNFLRGANRYDFLFFLDITDYRNWAKGLQQAGYATAYDYSRNLIELIEHYNLYMYDRQNSTILIAGNLENSNVVMVNDAKMVVATEGDTPLTLSYKTGFSVKSILRSNEFLNHADQKIPAMTRVFLQPKRNNYRGRLKWHYIKKGETMFYVSQLYGVKLKKLYRKNKMEAGTQPAFGEKVMLRGLFRRKNAPKLRPGDNSDLLLPPAKEQKEKADELEMGEEVFVPEEKVDDVISHSTSTHAPDTNVDDNIIIIEPEETAHTSSEDKIIIIEKPDVPVATPVANKKYHVVKRGDTLYGISRKYHVSVQQLKVWNNLKSNTIHKGRRLKVSQ